jgi:hypothetical protein
MYVFRFLSVIVLITFIVAATSAEDISQGSSITPPENWYQVEVILFSHPGTTSEEEAPNKSEFKFPQNLVELIDPQALEEAQSLRIEGALLQQEGNNVIENISDLFEFVDLSANQSDNEASGLIEISSRDFSAKIIPSPRYFDQLIPPEPWIAKYENPYELLPFSDRGLNDSARGLDRRKYNVLFHEAWRFIADDKINENWLVIGAGEKQLNRYELEGSLRFYKSRFLHFEADLWRINVVNDDSHEAERRVSKSFKLPPFPNFKPISENSVSWRVRSATPVTNDEIVDVPKTDSQNNFAVAEIVNLVGSNYVLEPYEFETQSIDEQATTETIDAVSIWPISHSKRIEEGEVYYLDHPEIGIMILVKSYLPEPLNLPSNNDFKADDSL